SALVYQPDLVGAHTLLAELYGGLNQRNEKGEYRRGYKDIELKHRKDMLKYTRANGKGSSETAQDFEERLKPLQQDVDQLEKYVEDQNNRFDNMRNRIARISNRAEE